MTTLRHWRVLENNRKPDREAIAQIIKYCGSRPSLHFNYRSKYNEVWASLDLRRPRCAQCQSLWKERPQRLATEVGIHTRSRPAFRVRVSQMRRRKPSLTILCRHCLSPTLAIPQPSFHGRYDQGRPGLERAELFCIPRQALHAPISGVVGEQG
jgi:hypothetical protein